MVIFIFAGSILGAKFLPNETPMAFYMLIGIYLIIYIA